MINLNDLKTWYGIDASNEISLLEYGLLVKKEPDKDDQYKIIYRVNSTQFDFCHFSEKEVNEFLNEGWFNTEGFLNYCGMTENAWLKMNIANKLSDLLTYYGFENICGTCYSPMSIDEINFD